MLARRYGGTPWQWRRASDTDWATGIALLNEEMERMKEAGYGS